MNKLKSKIAIVLGSNIHWAPYYYRYENLLVNKNIPFDLIIWNRENIEEKTKANNVIEYKTKDKSDNKNPFKVVKFIAFSNFVKKTLTKNKYEKIIFLGTHGCAPVFLANFLKKHFDKKYWLDIRDYQYEWFKPFYKLEGKTIKNAYATSISSKGYEEFLPKSKYYYMHNVDPKMDEFVKKYTRQENCSQIRISFIGNVRYYEENIKLINLFGNDDRYILQYFGAGSDKIKAYCEDKGIENVKFHGKFSTEDTIKFYNETDIINNVYGNNLVGLTTALSNKLYYSLCLKLPILVCEKTYMEKLTTEYEFGMVLKNDKNFPDKLYEEYRAYIENRRNPRYEELWDKIKIDEKEVKDVLNTFLQK